MPQEKLTDGYVDALTASGREVMVWDTALPRFGVRVTPAGSKVYLVQYRAKGAPGEGSKTRRIPIGKHDGDLWNVTKARAAARRLLAPVDLGHDPFAEAEAKRQAEAAAKAAAAEAEARAKREAEARELETYRAVTARYIDLAGKKNRTWTETERLLRFGDTTGKPAKRRSGHKTKPSTVAGPMKAWGERHIPEIRRSDVADLLDAIKKRSPAVARATYAALRGLFSWCLERDLIARSPCDGLTAPPRPTARDRVLGDDELRLIWLASDQLGYPFGPVVQLLMLTGQRRAEVAGMSWSELDREAGIWQIPANRSKNGKAHEVDLSPQAVAVLEAIPKSKGLVFPARNEGAVRGFSATKRRLDEIMQKIADKEAKGEAVVLRPWRLHDLRRSAATGMAALSFPPHVAERVLNHVSGTQSGLVGVYQRHEYRPERKAALTAWGVHVDAVVKAITPPSNVVQLRA
ncbi:MAG: integrase [Phenylobacterium zucineum]|nr:MAG: integrase [Phenylobacterium zucineum]